MKYIVQKTLDINQTKTNCAYSNSHLDYLKISYSGKSLFLKNINSSENNNK